MNATTSAMTPKQAEYRNSLKNDWAPRAWTMDYQSLAKYAMISMLPEPKTKEEASQQIDLLKSRSATSLQAYAMQHPEWRAEVKAKLDAVVGAKGEKLSEVLAQRKASLSHEEKMQLFLQNVDAWRTLVLDPILQGA